jgi:hypothetical protein
MPLTQAQIIEIQETAKHNYLRRLQEQEDKQKLQETVAQKIEERTKAPVLTTSDKKGK